MGENEPNPIPVPRVLGPAMDMAKNDLTGDSWDVGDRIAKIVDDFEKEKISEEELWGKLHRVEELGNYYRDRVQIKNRELTDNEEPFYEGAPTDAQRGAEVNRGKVNEFWKIISEIVLSRAICTAVIVAVVSFIGIGMYRRGLIVTFEGNVIEAMATASMNTQTPTVAPEQSKEPEQSQRTEPAYDKKPDVKGATIQTIVNQDTTAMDEDALVITDEPTLWEEQPPNKSMSPKPFASMVEQYTNDLRESEGLNLLVKDPCLTQAAVKRAEEIAVNHLTDHGSNWDHFVRDCPLDSYAENLSFHYEYPFEAYVGLKDSPSHRATMLGDYTKVGVGTYEKYEGKWVTVMYLGI